MAEVEEILDGLLRAVAELADAQAGRSKGPVVSGILGQIALAQSRRSKGEVTDE
jgi:hypothetical protein